MLLKEIVRDIQFLLGLEIDMYLIGTSMSHLSSSKCCDAVMFQEMLMNTSFLVCKEERFHYYDDFWNVCTDNRVSHKLDDIGNNANIGIRGFTTRKQKIPVTKCYPLIEPLDLLFQVQHSMKK